MKSYYLNKKSLEIALHEETSNPELLRLNPFLILVLAPILGLIFAVFLPALGFIMTVSHFLKVAGSVVWRKTVWISRRLLPSTTLSKSVESVSTKENKMNTKLNKEIGLAGACLGLFGFLMLALVPSLVYGGYAGLLLASGIFGSPVPSSFAARGLVAFGMLLGSIGVGSVFTVAGAAVGHLFAKLLGIEPKVSESNLAKQENK